MCLKFMLNMSFKPHNFEGNGISCMHTCLLYFDSFSFSFSSFFSVELLTLETFSKDQTVGLSSDTWDACTEGSSDAQK